MQLKPYNIAFLWTLKQEASISELFCDPELVFFSDETWLTVNSDVNSNRERDIGVYNMRENQKVKAKYI